MSGQTAGHRPQAGDFNEIRESSDEIRRLLCKLLALTLPPPDAPLAARFAAYSQLYGLWAQACLLAGSRRVIEASETLTDAEEVRAALIDVLENP